MHRKTRRAPFPRPLHRLGRWRVYLVFWLGAVVVGVLSVLFVLGADLAEQTFAGGVRRWPWLPLVLTPLGLGLIAWMTVRFAPVSRGSGVPQVIATLRTPSGLCLRERMLTIKVALSKIVLTTLGLACGASVGCGGPMVHVGAAVMFSLGRWARFSGRSLQRSLIVAGGAAGIAAAFGAPLAGVAFAVEEMSRPYGNRIGSKVLISVVLAGGAALLLLGDYDYFGSVEAGMDIVGGGYVILGCGVVGGILGGAFARGMITGSALMTPLYARAPVRTAMVCGLLVALIGLASGGSAYGTGYQETHAILHGGAPEDLLYPLWKILATLASGLSGIPGGIFAPALSTGAGLGVVIAEFFTSVPLTAVVLLAMTGYFSGIVRTPITAVVIVMEMTNNLDMAIPLMAVSWIATGVSRWICPRSVYDAMADVFLKASGFRGR